MNMKKTGLPVALLLMASLVAAAGDWDVPTEKENLHIFLLMGQSNMVGSGGVLPGDDQPVPGVLLLPYEAEGPLAWKPAAQPLFTPQTKTGFSLGLPFAVDYLKTHPGVRVGLVPIAIGGMDLNQLGKGRWPYAKGLAKAKWAAQTGVIKGVFWQQGESDTLTPELADSYAARLDKLVSDIRTDLGQPDLPFLAGQLAPEYGALWKNNPDRLQQIQTVREALKGLPERITNTAFVPSDGLKTLSDKVHLNRDSRIELGKRYAALLERLLNPAANVEATNGDSLKSAQALVARVLPEHVGQFVVEIIPDENGKDVFEFESADGTVILRGDNPVSVASALNWYLKHVANCHISWCGDQLNLPDPLPTVPAKVRIVNPSRFRVYFNYCTLSYTATWWDWQRWEREIDFMAMNGINMPLGVTGIEGAWYHTLLRMGFTDAETREFLVGPAYQAWQWMQNIEGFGGPLPMSWIDSHVKLGRQILDRQRELGMTPIQQGFSGAVPILLKEKFPDASMKQQGRWCNFPGVMQLDPTDPLFAKMGAIFLEEQQRLFGTSHYYGCDPFHESGPPKRYPGYLEEVGRAISDLLTTHDPEAIWCMQSWSLRKEILTAAPKDRMLVLDLSGRYQSSRGFFGYPFVAGRIHNFGGRTRMAGNLTALSRNPFAEALAEGDNCQGMGLFPEAIEQNPVYYDLAFDLIWRNEGVELNSWLHDYHVRRYGAESEAAGKAWEILRGTVYGTTTPSSVFVTRPVLDLKKSDPNNAVRQTYDVARFFKAWELLLSDADRLKDSAGYRYDVVDMGRQVLGDLAYVTHWAVADAFMDGDTNAFAQASRQFLNLFADADTLCSTEPLLSFRRWVRAAQAWATTPEERSLYTYNAGMLLTHWGPDADPEIFDYAWREWAGLLGGYYRGRWEKFHEMLAGRIARGESWSEAGLKLEYRRPVIKANAFYTELFDWEKNWIQSEKNYEADAVGDPSAVSRVMLEKYRPLAEVLFSPEGRKGWEKSQKRVNEAKLSEAFGTRVWRWTPELLSTDWQEVTFDITPFMETGSEFELTFLWETGGELTIRSVVVEQDGVNIARDEHEGRTGIRGGARHQNNGYTFEVPMVVPNAKYTVKASVRTDPSSKPAGSVWLKEKQ